MSLCILFLSADTLPISAKRAKFYSRALIYLLDSDRQSRLFEKTEFSFRVKSWVLNRSKLASYIYNQAMGIKNHILLLACFVLICLLGIVNAQNCQQVPSDYDFETFIAQFGKKYDDEEDKQQHKEAFEKRLQEIKQLNNKSDGTVCYGVNPMSDMTDEEKKAFFVVKTSNPNEETVDPPRLASAAPGNYPDTLDFRDLGLVSPVKNQGGCGSCWAFAAAAVYQTFMKKDSGITYDLAEQHLLQCTLDWGCGGGWGKDALRVAVDNGMPLESEYVYKRNHNYYDESFLCDQTDGYVKLQTNTSAVNIGRVNRLWSTPLTDDEMKSLTINYDTIMVTVSAGIEEFMDYSSGVLSCTTIQSYDHEVQLIGWTENAWIIKNSWGTGWGEGGYARITKNPNYNCQINKLIEYGDVEWASDDPESINIEMTDSAGNGWNGITLLIEQDGQQSIQFGGGFASGSSFAESVNLVPGIPARVIVGNYGRKRKQIGFVITDSSSNVLCKRTAGYNFPRSFVFCEFCPGCDDWSPEMTTLEYRLISKPDQSGQLLGYNGTELGFIQNGQVMRVGSQFGPGRKFSSWMDVQWAVGVSVQVVVLEVSDYQDTSYQGYKIRYLNRTSVAGKGSGETKKQYVEGKLYKTFTPLPYALTEAQLLQNADEDDEYEDEEEDQQFDKTPYAIALSVVCTLLVVFMALTVYLFVQKRKNEKFVKHQAPAPQPVSGTIMSATDM